MAAVVFPFLPQSRQTLLPRTFGFVPAPKVTKKQLCKVCICQQRTVAVAPPREVFIFLARVSGNTATAKRELDLRSKIGV